MFFRQGVAASVMFPFCLLQEMGHCSMSTKSTRQWLKWLDLTVIPSTASAVTTHTSTPAAEMEPSANTVWTICSWMCCVKCQLMDVEDVLICDCISLFISFGDDVLITKLLMYTTVSHVCNYIQRLQHVHTAHCTCLCTHHTHMGTDLLLNRNTVITFSAQTNAKCEGTCCWFRNTFETFMDNSFVLRPGWLDVKKNWTNYLLLILNTWIDERLKRTLTSHDTTQIFGVSPFVKWQNNT